MLLKTTNTYLWNARTLENQPIAGLITCHSKYSAKRQLADQGTYQISLTRIPEAITSFPLKTEELLSFLRSLSLMLKAGIPFTEALEMIQLENGSLAQRYVCYRLMTSLEQGSLIRDAFSELSSLFPAFFIAMMEISEQSGQLLAGLQSAYDFYEKKDRRVKEIKKVTRYPKIIFSGSLVLLSAVVIFIIPMFQNIYQLFGDELPIATKILVALSDLAYAHSFSIIVTLVGCCCWFTIPFLKPINPVLRLATKVRAYLESMEDPYVYALSMKMQLETGQPITIAAKNAALCLSARNTLQGERILKYLEAGYSLVHGFRQVKWFPPVFQQMISTAEKVGRLSLGFNQISQYLDQRRSERFSYWNKFLEPAMMMCLGTLVLLILLAVYLPIFDLGNRIG